MTFGSGSFPRPTGLGSSGYPLLLPCYHLDTGTGTWHVREYFVPYRLPPEAGVGYASRSGAVAYTLSGWSVIDTIRLVMRSKSNAYPSILISGISSSSMSPK